MLHLRFDIGARPERYEPQRKRKVDSWHLRVDGNLTLLAARLNFA